MKPIEVGCMAMIIYTKTDDFGKIVTVTSKDNKTDSPEYWSDCWFTNPRPTRVDSIREKWLLKIDDPDIQKQIEGETVIWNGEKVPVTGVIS